ncbi:SDR family mycofactocin-dependent oxidoreductase [Rhodococcus sp. ACS1]|uniref:mycofactocin-coupled SDR family oxidoreductase n=1 Tax=Rhodococcus sp. ACS1 TaxID=2028570 RepID=UPI000BB12804|nr:mycofactocin-coupled SDR family oxidoreductase [Rhodococcus sp. ACS1]PBC35336.1 SDR family mycofactocin-dependent oxidoreductase [Rhodococcus sp. ACS1]
MGRVENKVALVTGAGRGQGRNHALRLAEQGADIIALDACVDYASMNYGMATEQDLEQTAKLVKATGRKVITRRVDTRNLEGLKQVVSETVAELGKLDIVCANAGIFSAQPWDAVTPEVWRDTIDVNLTGTWHTCVAAIPHLLENGSGSIIITGSTSGVKGQPYFQPYVAAKHGVVGLMKSFANELAPKNIRVNVIHPTGVDTPALAGVGGLDGLLQLDPHQGPCFVNAMLVDMVEVDDISNAVLYLASDETRYVTGTELRVDAGNLGR